jgi:hypothetical protein
MPQVLRPPRSIGRSRMTEALHPLAPHHLPPFIVGPGESDVLLNAMIVLLIGAVLMVGNLYLQLHSYPERMAHRANRVQMEIVAVLCLLALFTHEHLFWIAALLLAMIQFPDFSTPLNRIADSLDAGSDRAGRAPAVEGEPEPPQLTEVKPHLTEVR